jgi:hypothetical protein
LIKNIKTKILSASLIINPVGAIKNSKVGRVSIKKPIVLKRSNSDFRKTFMKNKFKTLKTIIWKRPIYPSSQRAIVLGGMGTTLLGKTGPLRLGAR